MSRNLRGAYLSFAHDRAADWEWLAAWQPSVIRVMVQGSHDHPGSVSVDKIERLHKVCPDALLLIRCWDVDDRNFEAHGAMVANPVAEAERQVQWWARVFDRISVPRDRLMAGLNNEVHPSHSVSLFEYTKAAMTLGKHLRVRLGVGVFSVGNPSLPGEGGPGHDMAYFSQWERQILEGNHALVLHEYMQPEGMYAVWTDDQGKERKDYTYLIGRHARWPMKVPIIIGEWGIDGILYNRHPHSQFGNSGWVNFPEWEPVRFADEYVECCQMASRNVIGICPFITDFADRKWASFDTLAAHGELIKRKDLCYCDNVILSPDRDTSSPVIVGDGPKEQPVVSNIIEPKVAQAILQIESGGQTHGPGGRVIIRFEPHIFAQYVDPDVWADHFYTGDPMWAGEHHRFKVQRNDFFQAFHGNQGKEYEALEVAKAINPEAAYLSISMGAGQIMGFNHKRVGFPTAEAMYQVFSKEAPQIIAFINYFLSDSALVQAMHQKDWRTIASKYNGAGNVEVYSKLLQDAYNNL